jgi:uncharacterized glyoxalase superfamily protein PhnB
MRLYRVIIMVTDIAKAADFYGRILDAAGKRVSPGRHYFHDDAGLVVACYDPRADGDDPGEGSILHENHYLYLSTPDLQRAHANAVLSGAREVGAIEDMPWGERLFYCRDPLGNPLSFVQAGTEFTG